jgi:ribonuclease HII
MREILVCGLDEVGRGALAGPLMACAALFKLDAVVTIDASPIPGLMDSKAFSSRTTREKIWKSILRSPFLLDFCVGEVSVEEINAKGIEWANNVAFQRSIAGLDQAPHYLIVDGINPVEGWPIETQTVESKADAKYWPVSAASIIAKVVRDYLMIELAAKFPSYGWSTNMGYGSSKHQNAIKTNGPSIYHRTQFIKNLI